MRTDILILILGMMLVTYIPRMLPAVLLEKLHFGPKAEKFLQLVPYTAMAALISRWTPQDPTSALRAARRPAFLRGSVCRSSSVCWRPSRWILRSMYCCRNFFGAVQPAVKNCVFMVRRAQYRFTKGRTQK